MTHWLDQVEEKVRSLFKHKSTISYSDVQDVLVTSDRLIDREDISDLLESIPECADIRAAEKYSTIAASYTIPNANQLMRIHEYIEHARPSLDFLVHCFYRIGHAAAFIRENSIHVLTPYMFYITNILCKADGPILIAIPQIAESSRGVLYNPRISHGPFASSNLLLLGTSRGMSRIGEPGAENQLVLYKEGPQFDMDALKSLLLSVSSSKHVKEMHPTIWNKKARNHDACVWKMPLLVLLILFYHSSNEHRVCHLINSILDPATTHNDLNSTTEFPNIPTRHRNIVPRPAQFSVDREARLVSVKDSASTQEMLSFQLYPFKVNYTMKDLKGYTMRAHDIIFLGLQKFIQEMDNDTIYSTDYIELPNNDETFLTIVHRLKEIEKHLNSKVRLLIIPLSLGKQYSHANLLIIDLYRLESEHYEPHGWHYMGLAHEDFQKKVKSIVERAFPWIKKHYTPMEYGPCIGIQSTEFVWDKEKFEEGYCEVWVLIYAVHRILYPDIPRSDLLSLIKSSTSHGHYENPPKPVRLLRLLYETISLGDTNSFEYARRAAAWLSDVHKLNDESGWRSKRYALPQPKQDTIPISIQGSLSKSSSKSKSKSKSRSKSRSRSRPMSQSRSSV
jgi:hypothetical protein